MEILLPQASEAPRFLLGERSPFPPTFILCSETTKADFNFFYETSFKVG